MWHYSISYKFICYTFVVTLFAKHDRASSYVVMRQCLYRNSIYQFFLKTFRRSSKFKVSNCKYSNLFERRFSVSFTIFCWMINYNMLLNCCKLNKTTLHSWLATAFTSLCFIYVSKIVKFGLFLITKLFWEQEWK